MKTVIGSSPRVWGQAAAGTAQDLSSRIIPTRVGTRHSEISSEGSSQDHPHACGDKGKAV